MFQNHKYRVHQSYFLSLSLDWFFNVQVGKPSTQALLPADEFQNQALVRSAALT